MKNALPVLVLVSGCDLFKIFAPVDGVYTLSGATLADDSCGLFDGEFDPEEVNGDTI